MSKEIIVTICGVVAVIVAIFMMAWVIRGDIAANNAMISANAAAISANAVAISANTEAIAELRDDVRELRGLLITHIASHSQAPVVAKAPGNLEAETQ